MWKPKKVGNDLLADSLETTPQQPRPSPVHIATRKKAVRTASQARCRQQLRLMVTAASQAMDGADRNDSRSVQPMASHALNVGSHTTTRPYVASPSAGSSQPSPPHNHHSMTQPIFEALCSLDSTSPTTAHIITLDHHVYNELYDVWERRASDPRHIVNVTIQAIPSDAQALGFPTIFVSPTATVLYPAMADTGCQSCLADISLLPKLGLERRQLTPVTMKMTAANNHGIHIAGALVLRISGTSPTGQTLLS